jgi:hypothetical protein
VIGFCNRSAENHLIWTIVVSEPETSIVSYTTVLTESIIRRLLSEDNQSREKRLESFQRRPFLQYTRIQSLSIVFWVIHWVFIFVSITSFSELWVCILICSTALTIIHLNNTSILSLYNNYTVSFISIVL